MTNKAFSTIPMPGEQNYFNMTKDVIIDWYAYHKLYEKEDD